MQWSEIPIPDDMKGKVEQARAYMIEKAAECDDTLTEKYLAGEELTIEEIRARSTAQGDDCHHHQPGPVRLGAEIQGRAASAQQHRLLPSQPAG